MAVRLECRGPRPVGLQIKALCVSGERNSLATKSEHSRSVISADDPRPSRECKIDRTNEKARHAAGRDASITFKQYTHAQNRRSVGLSIHLRTLEALTGADETDRVVPRRPLGFDQSFQRASDLPYLIALASAR
jgi:hypothetical protein